MKKLNSVTLCCVDCYNYGAAIAALKKSLQQISPARTIFLTDIPIKQDGIEVIQIPPIKSKSEYSQFCIKELHKYFDTDFVLLVQNDGWVINGDSWEDEFMDYDFIGAPWLYVDGRNVGNGGVSLRSKKLQTILGEDEHIQVSDPEDEVIGRLYRRYLEEKYDIEFPSEELADRFSYELRTPVYKTFAFHGNFHKPYQPTVIIRRTGAMGDVIQTEPLMAYFYDKGYRVVLETLSHFHLLFVNHHFKVHRMNEVDGRVLKTARFVNLDMSYESDPKKLHLRAYFEFAGVEDYEDYIRNPKLSLGFYINAETKLFKKYCVLHIDERPQPHRNIYGVNWTNIVFVLAEKGYDVFQLGRGEHEEIPGAIQINCTNENFLCYVVGGADLMIGNDSGISNIAISFGVPVITFHGSVNPEYIYPDMSNVVAIHNHDKNVCSTPFCWHDIIGCDGQDCVVDKKNPPCTQFKTQQLIDAINKLIK